MLVKSLLTHRNDCRPETLVSNISTRLCSDFTALRQKGVTLEVLTTENAIAAYNFLVEEGRVVAAALIPPSNVRLIFKLKYRVMELTVLGIFRQHRQVNRSKFESSPSSPDAPMFLDPQSMKSMDQDPDSFLGTWNPYLRRQK
jgi:hypothetical protein